MFVCLTFVALVLSVVVEGTNVKAHFPEPKSGTYPHLRIESTLPNLNELTACFWVKFTSRLNSSEDFIVRDESRTILSYATPRNHNEFVIELFNRKGKAVLRVYRGIAHVYMDCRAYCKIGSWCHICVSWFGSDGRVSAVVDDDSCEDSFLNFNEPYIPTGGVLVIGQEQDALDSKYDVSQAWVGDIADVQLWDEVLSGEQMLEAGICGGKRQRGNIVSWLDTPMVATDGVVLSGTQLCLP